MPDNATKKRILLVEKSATLRYMLGKNIQNYGYEIISEKNFEAALEKLQSGELDLHGVLIGWPNYEHFKHSKQLLVLLDEPQYKTIPVILLSNNTDIELLNWMSRRKSSAFIPWESYREVAFTLHAMLQPKKAPVYEQRKESRDSKPMRVLFVDDSKSIRAYYQKLLERNNYVVETASSVNQAYGIAIKRPIDIAIVDYFMPGEDGYVLCQRLRDNPVTADIRTAVITGTYLDAVIRDCLQAGAVECMFKNEAEELFLARMASMRRFIEIQRSIEKQRENLAAILESVGEGVYGVDKKGRVKFINPAALSILGLPDDTHISGQFAADVFHSNKQENGAIDHLKQGYLSGNKLKSWETVFRHKSGKLVPVDCSLFPLTVAGKNEGSVVAFRDISDRRMLEEKLRWQATHDYLTGLFNRRYFENYLSDEIKRIKRSGIMGAMVYIDLDRFKYVNDTAGHEVGDYLLVNLSKTLMRTLRKNDVAARIGGDEFAVILKNVDADLALELADEIRHVLSDLRVSVDSEVYHVNASFGVVMLDNDMIADENITAGDLMANADIACHISKRLGRNQTHLYQQSSDERNIMGAELGWSTRLRDALDNNKFQLHYQPILKIDDIDLMNLPAQNGALWQRHLSKKEKVCSYEVLVRMESEDGSLFFPDSFIPTAERFNLMTSIDHWVFEHALKDLTATGADLNSIRLSINLSGHTIDNEESLEWMKALIEKYQVPPAILTFEVTETSAIGSLASATKFINDFKEMGCRFSLDDFGSGFCSFSQLKNLATDFVKIDGQFVKNMARGATDRAIVTAMNDVVHSLGRCTVAEYVETPEVLRLLKICGVDRAQGYYISEPLEKLPVAHVLQIRSKSEM